jgi:hypothetical protein
MRVAMVALFQAPASKQKTVFPDKILYRNLAGR